MSSAEGTMMTCLLDLVRDDYEVRLHNTFLGNAFSVTITKYEDDWRRSITVSERFDLEDHLWVHALERARQRLEQPKS